MNPNWVLSLINYKKIQMCICKFFFLPELNFFFLHHKTRPSFALKLSAHGSNLSTGFKDLSPLKSLRTPPPPPYAVSSLKFFSLFYLTALPIISTPTSPPTSIHPILHSLPGTQHPKPCLELSWKPLTMFHNG